MQYYLAVEWCGCPNEVPTACVICRRLVRFDGPEVNLGKVGICGVCWLANVLDKR